jgi:dynein heavy chain, axonemal
LAVPPQAILAATQKSFAAMKRRLGSKTCTGIFYLERPFFDVDVELKVRESGRRLEQQ